MKTPRKYHAVMGISHFFSDSFYKAYYQHVSIDLAQAKAKYCKLEVWNGKEYVLVTREEKELYMKNKRVGALYELANFKVTFKSVSVYFEDPFYNYTTAVNLEREDWELLAYFGAGKVLNLGSVEDDLQTVKCCKIITCLNNGSEHITRDI